MLVFVGALAVSFAPPAWPASQQPSDGFSLMNAQRAIDAGAALARSRGMHTAFVVLMPDGEPVIAAEVTGTSAQARNAATGRAACLAANFPGRGQTSLGKGHGQRCIVRGAEVVRWAEKPVAIFAVAGAGEVKDEQILEAMLGAARP